MKKLSTYAKMLIMAALSVAAMTSCRPIDDHYLAEQLVNKDWQGYLGVYYSDRWNVSGQEYNTVMRFTSIDSYATSGRGYELDYRVNSWRDDYAYCTFKWFIVDGELTLIYDDDAWSPIYIYYRLSETRFYGYIDDGTQRNIQFELESRYFDHWDDYRYGVYWSRGAKEMGDSDTATVAPIVKTFADDGMSIRSGVFAQ